MLIRQVALASSYGAVMAIDSHTGAPLSGPLLTFDGQTKPVRYKKDGYCVLTAPLGGAATCRVSCPGYAPWELPVACDPNGRFFALAALSPMAGNPRYARRRRQLARVLSGGSPVADAAVRVALAGRIPALLLTKAAAKGDDALWLNAEGELRLIGQWLALPGKAEAAQVVAIDPEAPGRYILSAPMTAQVAQSAQAVPFWHTVTDGKGELILPWKPHLMRQEAQSLEITCGGATASLSAGFEADSCLTIEI